MSYINKLKKDTDRFERLSKTLTQIANPEDSYKAKDDRFWTPTVDKAGNGYAVIRFLPHSESDGEDANDFVKYFDHGFQGPTGRWYIEKSLTTFEKKDPVGELNSRLWNTKAEIYQDIARKQKRKLHYVANVLIVEDSGNPANNGKVKLFRYGKKIHDKIHNAMFPIFPDKARFDPFDLWKGANFKLKIRTVSGYRNNEASEFADNTPVSDNDKVLDSIMSQTHSLQDLVSKDKFKTYDELKEALDTAIGGDSASDDVFALLTAKPKTGGVTATRSDTPRPSRASKPVDDDPPFDVEEKSSGSDDDDMDYFKSLADKD